MTGNSGVRGLWWRAQKRVWCPSRLRSFFVIPRSDTYFSLILEPRDFIVISEKRQEVDHAIRTEHPARRLVSEPTYIYVFFRTVLRSGVSVVWLMALSRTLSNFNHPEAVARIRPPLQAVVLRKNTI